MYLGNERRWFTPVTQTIHRRRAWKMWTSIQSLTTNVIRWINRGSSSFYTKAGSHIVLMIYKQALAHISFWWWGLWYVATLHRFEAGGGILIKAGLLVALNLHSITGQSFAHTRIIYSTLASLILVSTFAIYNVICSYLTGCWAVQYIAIW